VKKKDTGTLVDKNVGDLASKYREHSIRIQDKIKYT
jgi:hypothetical protein